MEPARVPSLWALGRVGLSVVCGALERALSSLEALAAGAADNGAPGLRPQYHPDYYAAFVLDPDGHNLEAVRRRAI